MDSFNACNKNIVVTGICNAESELIDCAHKAVKDDVHFIITNKGKYNYQ